MKNVIIILLLYIVCTAVTCEKKENENCHRAINFSNNLSKDLYVRGIRFNFIAPGADELGYFRNTVSPEYKVKSGEQNNRRATDLFNSCHEWNFDAKGGNSDTLNVFVFEASVIENTPWEVVARDYLVLKRYDLTLGDLQRLDWRVTYPPTEAMKDIKQYPPYGE